MRVAAQEVISGVKNQECNKWEKDLFLPLNRTLFTSAI